MRRLLAVLLLAALADELSSSMTNPESVAVIERAIRETGQVAALPPDDRLFTEAFLP